MPAVAKTQQLYGSAQNFLITFSKQIQTQTAQHPERAYLGTAPSLNIVRKTYNQNLLNIWLITQLEDINDFVGIKDKMTIAQMEYIAHIIATEYGYLKVTEIHLFLHKLKAGYYGVFYGCIDPLKITQALLQFSEQRRIEIANFERKKQQKKLEKQRQQWQQTAITRQEYYNLKNKLK